MSTPEKPSELSTESLDLISQESFKRANQLAQELSSSAYASESRTGLDNFYFEYALTDLADIAAHEDNTDKVLEYAEKLERLPNPNATKVASIYHLAANLGNFPAFEKLSSMLDAEKSKTAQEVATDTSAFRILQSPILADIVENCARKQLSAGSWIDNYAVDNEQVFTLQMKYYSESKREDLGDQPLAQHALNRSNQLLLTDGSMNNITAFDSCWLSLASQTDPDIQNRIANRFQDLCNSGEIPLSVASFNRIVTFANKMLDSPGLSTQERVEYFTDLISSCAQQLIDGGVDPFTVNKSLGAWEVNLAFYNGTSDKELIEKVDLWCSKTLSYDNLPESIDYKDISTVFKSKETILRARDHFLDTLANENAKHGNFQSSKVFLDQFGDLTAKLYSVKRCLKAAKTPEDIDMLVSSDMELLFEPDLADQIEVARYMLSRDIEDIINKATEIAEVDADDISALQFDLISQLVHVAYEVDTHKATDFTYRLIEKLKTKTGAYSDVKWLRNLLIQKAGDLTQYLHRMRDLEHSDQPARQMHGYADLAKELYLRGHDHQT